MGIHDVYGLVGLEYVLRVWGLLEPLYPDPQLPLLPTNPSPREVFAALLSVINSKLQGRPVLVEGFRASVLVSSAEMSAGS